MAGQCRKCKFVTTDTRAASEHGLCFCCEHGLAHQPKPPAPLTYVERLDELSDTVETGHWTAEEGLRQLIKILRAAADGTL